ncbi:phage baseplate assembly protein domain-containing protein [Acidisoma sp. 7E03]
MAGPDPTFEPTMQQRGQIVRGLVHAVNDNGGKQTIEVETHDGRVLSAVPVYFPFGFSSRVPAAGAVAPVLAAGGDQSDPIALPPENPGAARFGNLADGESVMYDLAGNRLHFRNGELAELIAVKVLIHTQQATVTSEEEAIINLPQGGVINGDLVQNGNLTVNGDLGVVSDGESGGNVTAKNVAASGEVSDHKSSMDGMRAIYNDHTNPPGGTETPPQQM